MSLVKSTRFPLPSSQQCKSIDKFWSVFDGLLAFSESSEKLTNLTSAKKSLLLSRLIDQPKKYDDLTISELTQLIRDIDGAESKCA